MILAIIERTKTLLEQLRVILEDPVACNVNCCLSCHLKSLFNKVWKDCTQCAMFSNWDNMFAIVWSLFKFPKRKVKDDHFIINDYFWDHLLIKILIFRQITAPWPLVVLQNMMYIYLCFVCLNCGLISVYNLAQPHSSKPPPQCSDTPRTQFHFIPNLISSHTDHSDHT